FFQAEDGIRAFHVTGVQTCALPILQVHGGIAGGAGLRQSYLAARRNPRRPRRRQAGVDADRRLRGSVGVSGALTRNGVSAHRRKIGRASCRERGSVEGTGAAETKTE